MSSRIFRRLGALAVAAVALVLPSCLQDGHLTMFGYTTAPNHDCGIRTVYVPIFKNVTYRRNLEFDLTRAVIREIESKTPYKVVSDCNKADTELLGTIVSRGKNIIQYNQLFETREAETTMTVEIVWRDLRPGHVGEVLSRPQQLKPAELVTPGSPPQPPVLVQSLATFIPEVGMSLTTAEQQNVNRLATQIVSMMERPW
jgi:hypothetical protein